MRYPPGLSAHLTEHGSLFYNGKVSTPDDSFLSRGPWKSGATLEVGWNGEVQWEVRHPDHHHDGFRPRNGNVLLLSPNAS